MPKQKSNHIPIYQTLLNMERTIQALESAFEAALSQFGLSQAQWDTLRHLRDCPGASGADLARMVKISLQAVATMLQRLEKAQLITRREAQSGRAVETYLTTQGELLLSKGEQVAEQIEARTFSTFSMNEKEQFNNYLLQCVANLDGSKL